MNIVIEYALQSNAPHFVSRNTSFPLIRAFMDDINIMSASVAGAKSLLNRCTTALSWAGLEFRASKSRSMVIVKGRSMNSTPFSVSSSKEFSNGTSQSFIPSIHTNPVRFLGRIIDGTISDRNSITELEGKLISGLELIDKSFYSGPQKLWILQHLLIPRIQWPILIYELSISVASRLEQKVSSLIRKWLNLHKSISCLSFYSSSSPCQLPIKSLTSVLKASKISGHLLLQESKDPLISDCVPNLNSGSWNAKTAVSMTERDVHLKSNISNANYNCSGLGYSKTSEVPSDKSSKEYRQFICKHHQSIDETYAFSKAVQMPLQGQWTRWLNYIQNDFSWKTILAMPPNLISFCINSTYNTLPSPSNLQRWNITTEATCTLCNKQICTLPHILGACKVALKQGRYTFRHDAVLSKIVSYLTDFIGKVKPTPMTETFIKFVKKGTAKRKPKKRKPPTGLLHFASDWCILVDNNKEYSFPFHIALTELRPDIVLYSNKTKRVIIIELTCPCEENMDLWHNTKIQKYSHLRSVIQAKGWVVDLFAVEVGARGYSPRSLLCCLLKLGFPNSLAKKVLAESSKTSMECSFCIWISRNKNDWAHDGNTTPFTSQHGSAPSPAPKIKNSKQVTPIGFVNKGNTCYANAILQVLSILPALWNTASAEANTLSPLSKAIALNMALKERSLSPIDPSNFLWALKRTMHKSKNVNFDFNSQQDAVEILQHVLNELKGTSVAANDIVSNRFRTTITCNECFCTSLTEEDLDIVSLPFTKSIEASFEKHLSPETLSSHNMWFCPSCETKRVSTRETALIHTGCILIVQIKRFAISNNVTSKNEEYFKCLPSSPQNILKVPITSESEVSFSNKYSLVATINHSGNLNNGHYWAFIKSGADGWYSCNDKVVTKTKVKVLNNKSSYILFYVRK